MFKAVQVAEEAATAAVAIAAEAVLTAISLRTAVLATMKPRND